jgi:hypothetical protein
MFNNNEGRIRERSNRDPTDAKPNAIIQPKVVNSMKRINSVFRHPAIFYPFVTAHITASVGGLGVIVWNIPSLVATGNFQEALASFALASAATWAIWRETFGAVRRCIGDLIIVCRKMIPFLASADALLDETRPE